MIQGTRQNLGQQNMMAFGISPQRKEIADTLKSARKALREGDSYEADKGFKKAEILYIKEAERKIALMRQGAEKAKQGVQESVDKIVSEWKKRALGDKK